MLGISGLLVISQTGTFTTQVISLPVQCAFQSFRPDSLYYFDIPTHLGHNLLGRLIPEQNTSTIQRSTRIGVSQDWMIEVLARPLIRKDDVRNGESSGQDFQSIQSGTGCHIQEVATEKTLVEALW